MTVGARVALAILIVLIAALVGLLAHPVGWIILLLLLLLVLF